MLTGIGEWLDWQHLSVQFWCTWKDKHTAAMWCCEPGARVVLAKYWWTLRVPALIWLNSLHIVDQPFKECIKPSFNPVLMSGSSCWGGGGSKCQSTKIRCKILFGLFGTGVCQDGYPKEDVKHLTPKSCEQGAPWQQEQIGSLFQTRWGWTTSYWNLDFQYNLKFFHSKLLSCPCGWGDNMCIVLC